MEGLLTPVSTSYKSSENPFEDALILVDSVKSPAPKPSFQPASTPAEALKILRSEPDHDTLVSTLRYLADCSGFRIQSPSPLASQLVHVLVSDIVPNYWIVLQQGRKLKVSNQGSSDEVSGLELLLSCLRSVSGVNATLLSLKRHIQQSNESRKAVGGPNSEELLSIYLQLLQALLERSQTVETIWSSIYGSSGLQTAQQTKQKTVWNEFLSLVGCGKILSIAAEAEDVINDLSKKFGEKHWIADGSLYSSWLARNLVHWIKNLSTNSEIASKCCGELIGKSFRLGYTENVVKELLSSLLLDKAEYLTRFTKLLNVLSSFEYRNFLYIALKVSPGEYFSATVTTNDDAQWWQSNAKMVSSVAALITKIVNDNVPHQKEHLIHWLTGSSGAGLGDGIAIRRAVLVALSRDKADIEVVLDKSLQQFGDELYIKHTPTLQQEVHAQVLLLAAGYVHRKSPLHLAVMMRSGAHLNAVSNRLAASSPRARFLGMAVGEALSSLVDKGDKKMDFKVDEMSTPEAKWFKSLVNVSDSIGSIEPLRSRAVAKIPRPAKLRVSKPADKSNAPPTGSKIISIEEVQTDEEESDKDGLTPYAKPDSDAEDSDEDPTLITRNKPTAPVYIRDLISYLRDTENYDRQKLGIETAAPLIRRKTNFGKEVTDHAEELATLLVGLQDKYEIDNFQEIRLQGMIAILVASPLKMGQWFSKTFFDGDYSISQRASVLTTLGLGARELGGFGAEDSTLTSIKALPSTSFPSKTLPENLHRLYGGKPTTNSALNALSTQLSNTMIAPLAADLADKLTGPAILKVRTFSSRMAVEKKRKKPIANSLAKVVADGFFFPLTGRFFIHLKAYGSSHNNVIFQPYLLALFIKTLSLLLHASGPSTLSLPQMTSEFWDLLLSLRTQSIGDITVIEALLFGFMTILEINEDKRSLVEAHGRQLLETQEWIEGVFGRVGGGGSEEDERVRMLAAGVLVRARECVEKYQALLMGDLASF